MHSNSRPENLNLETYDESWNDTVRTKYIGVNENVLEKNDEKKNENNDLEDEEDDNGSSGWKERKKKWLFEQWLTVGRPRGFSFFGVLESAVGMMGKFIGGMIFEDEEEEEDEKEVNHRDSTVNYKGHQLLRITPKSKKQVRYLHELRQSEPDDVRFWTIPAKDKYTLL